MQGIHFITNIPVRKVLEALMSCGSLSAYFWHVGRYIPLSEERGIDEGLYSPAELKMCIARLTTGEVAENFCMFGSETPHPSAGILPGTFDEYLQSTCRAALVCWDICSFDFYCKDMNVLLNVQKMLNNSALCLAEEIHVIEDGQHSRTSFGI